MFLTPGFQGQPFTPLAWGTVDGTPVYLPTFIRNYYTKNWFDFYLKGQEMGLTNLETNPVEDLGILDIKSSISE